MWPERLMLQPLQLHSRWWKGKVGRKDHAYLFKDTIHCFHCIYCFCSEGKDSNYHMASTSYWEMLFLCCVDKSLAIRLGTSY